MIIKAGRHLSKEDVVHNVVRAMNRNKTIKTINFAPNPDSFRRDLVIHAYTLE